MKNFLKVFGIGTGIFLGILILFILVFIFVIIFDDRPTLFCETAIGEREQCLNNPPVFEEQYPAFVYQYAQEFTTQKQPSWVKISDAPAEATRTDWYGSDTEPKTGAQLIVNIDGCSERGCNQDDGKNLYVRLSAHNEWQQVAIPEALTAWPDATWVAQHGTPKVFAELYRSDRPLFQKRNPPPIYLYDPVRKEWSYLFWGRRAMVSPDRKHAVFMRGENGEFFSYYVWDVETDILKPLFMIQESHETHVDLAWEVTWTDDSQAIAFKCE